MWHTPVYQVIVYNMKWKWRVLIMPSVIVYLSSSCTSQASTRACPGNGWVDGYKWSAPPPKPYPPANPKQVNKPKTKLTLDTNVYDFFHLNVNSHMFFHCSGMKPQSLSHTHVVSWAKAMFYIEMDETTKFTSHVCHELFKAIFYI